MIKKVTFEMHSPEESKEEVYLFLADIIDKQISNPRFSMAVDNIESLAELIQHYPGMEKETEALGKIVEGAHEMLCIPAIADKILAKRREETEAREMEAVA